MIFPGWRENEREKYDTSVRALKRLAKFIRWAVREMGEMWYVEHMIYTIPRYSENMPIIVMCIDDFVFAKDGLESFEFEI